MPDLWEPKRRIERRYAQSIAKLIDQVLLAVRVYKEPDAIIAALRDYVASRAFQRAAETVAMKMVTGLYEDGQKTWRSAARANSQARVIYEALRKELQGPTGAVYYDLIYRNSMLIKTLPEDIAAQASVKAAAYAQKGYRAEAIAERIQLLIPEGSTARAKLIARTEVSKASTALTQARCADMSIRWYDWRTCEDSRVRSSHSHMEHVLIPWDDPPSPEQLAEENHYGYYHAGNTFNCRCYPEPLIETHYVSWPHKVYRDGRIQRMTKAEFERIM